MYECFPSWVAFFLFLAVWSLLCINKRPTTFLQLNSGLSIPVVPALIKDCLFAVGLCAYIQPLRNVLKMLPTFFLYVARMSCGFVSV